jgi:hypothetical protein
VGLLVPLLALERRMKRTGGPGIIPFELAGTPARAGRIMDAWGTDGRRAARLSLVLDFPFLVAYSGLHANVCGRASEVLRERGWRRAADLGGVARTAQIVAGACDAVENAALLGVLARRATALPRIAQAFAAAKFALLAVGAAYAAAGLAAKGR